MNGLDPAMVTRTAIRSVYAMGFLCVSVFVALDQTLGELCGSLDELARSAGSHVTTGAEPGRAL